MHVQARNDRQPEPQAYGPLQSLLAGAGPGIARAPQKRLKRGYQTPVQHLLAATADGKISRPVYKLRD